MIGGSSPVPLHIDELRCADFPGVIGMTFCPGRRLSGWAQGSDWNRDLAVDLAAIEAWGAEMLISLIEAHEYEFVGVGRMHELMPRGVFHLRLPIADASVPTPAWEFTWMRAGPSVREVLRRGGKICIHCMGGLGRTGLLAARILVEFGQDPERAIRTVRAARPGTIETAEQESYIRTLTPGSAVRKPRA